jgi:hypothetical protein
MASNVVTLNALLLACVQHSAWAGEVGSDRSWAVKIGRRPYINEAEGALYLHAPSASIGQQIHVSAALPCANRTWSWNFTNQGTAAKPEDKVLVLDDLSSLPARLHNDMVITLTHGATNAGSRRIRFARATKADLSNTVQVDHRTSGLLVDGEPWAGWGWYVYPYLTFVQKGTFTNQSNMTQRYEALIEGTDNQRAALAKMGERGINLVMPYSLSPWDGKHGLPTHLGPDYNATAINQEIVMRYLDQAAKHQVKVLFDMCFMGFNKAIYDVGLLERTKEVVAFVKDHPALLAYYICDDCHPQDEMAQIYNTLKELDPYHIVSGATFGAVQNYGDGIGSHAPTSDDTTAVLPGLRANGHGTKLEPAVQPKSALQIDFPLIENYSPNIDAHAKTDGGLASDWLTPVVNCDGAYTFAGMTAKNLQTAMWMSTAQAGVVNQLIFAGNRPVPMEGIHAIDWGSKIAWMLYMQVEMYSAKARAILPSLYAPFGLPQPEATLANVSYMLPLVYPGMPAGRRFGVRAWRQETTTGWCGHLLVVSSAQATSAQFTVKLAGSFPVGDRKFGVSALRLFDANYKVNISNDGLLTDWIGPADHSIYQLGECGRKAVAGSSPEEISQQVLI